MKENGNAPAYPAMDMNSHMGIDRLELRYTGFTKREAFAMAAMQGIIANSGGGPPDVAHRAVVMADELLKALEK